MHATRALPHSISPRPQPRPTTFGCTIYATSTWNVWNRFSKMAPTPKNWPPVKRCSRVWTMACVCCRRSCHSSARNCTNDCHVWPGHRVFALHRTQPLKRAHGKTRPSKRKSNSSKRQPKWSDRRAAITICQTERKRMRLLCPPMHGPAKYSESTQTIWSQPPTAPNWNSARKHRLDAPFWPSPVNVRCIYCSRVSFK